MTRWTIDVPEDLDSRVRDHVADHGGGELSAYVQKAVRRQVFWETVQDIRERNAGVDPQVIEREVGKALDEVRADRA
jgi:hypothetical protein